MKYTTISYTLSFILLGLMSHSVQGFQPITSSSVSLSAPSFQNNNNALHASLIDPEEPEKPIVVSTTATSKDENLAWKKFCEINNKFWDYTVNFFYVFMITGILLNLSGFAYKVDLEHGFTVETIQERRQELQWQKEMQRYDQQGAMKQKALLEQVVENH